MQIGFRFGGRGVCLGVNCAEIAVAGNCAENFEVILDRL